MPLAATRRPAPRDPHQAVRSRDQAEAATSAAKRALAAIEATAPHGPAPIADRETLHRAGRTLHRAGGAALVGMVYAELCAAAPERAARRFDVLAEAWGGLLSKMDGRARR